MNKSNKLWSLNIPINLKKVDKDTKYYLKICEEKLGLVPNILKTNAINKKKFDAFNKFYNRIMQDDNYLSIKEKEMIAVVVSSTNRCIYCCISHGYNLSKILDDKVLSKNILINYRTAKISKKHKKMLDFAYKLTSYSHLIDEDDRNLLRKANFSENHILEIIDVTAFFNMTNRIASGTNMKPNPDYY